MYKVFEGILTIIWIMDIMNLSCMEWLDTTVPINGVIWFLIWLLLPTTEYRIKIGDDD